MFIARLGDSVQAVCTAHDSPKPVTGTITAGVPIVLVEGQPATYIGAVVTFPCGHSAMITASAGMVFVGGIPVARLGDSVTGVASGSIVKSSSKGTAN